MDFGIFIEIKNSSLQDWDNLHLVPQPEKSILEEKIYIYISW